MRKYMISELWSSSLPPPVPPPPPAPLPIVRYRSTHKPSPASSVSDFHPFVSPSCPFNDYYLLMSHNQTPQLQCKSHSTSTSFFCKLLLLLNYCVFYN